jgi:hypothetical protein
VERAENKNGMKSSQLKTYMWFLQLTTGNCRALLGRPHKEKLPSWNQTWCTASEIKSLKGLQSKTQGPKAEVQVQVQVPSFSNLFMVLMGEWVKRDPWNHIFHSDSVFSNFQLLALFPPFFCLVPGALCLGHYNHEMTSKSVLIHLFLNCYHPMEECGRGR